MTLSPDGLRLKIHVANRKPGRVYDLRSPGVTNANGDKLLHAEAYYTLNEIPK